VDLKCPRTLKESAVKGVRKDYDADLQERFGYLKEYATQWHVNGVLLQSVRYCDGHGYEVPAVKDFFAGLGLPSVCLEHDYSEGALAPLRTRVQGLTEIIG
jgi:benzoyl-CoA reductase subunit C